ncbi:MAP3K7 C-terminal-like protein isoform X2 [Geospiza fortis]|uniref:MAP3K7 C-terminal-like protein isoform X2 n=1 Tax=Geospiza fortis TaxID=48883 RepID=A0A8N5EZM4_GEOFO|nr:MAP3K7 C-terminal-like protein isoform X2 [Geospiza fortis]
MAGSKQLEQTSKSIDSSAHMITTARVPADKQVRIAFSLNDSPDDASPENFSLAFPELDQQLQPLPPCHDSKESMQVYKQHCKIAEEYHEVKKEIALLEERNTGGRSGSVLLQAPGIAAGEHEEVGGEDNLVSPSPPEPPGQRQHPNLALLPAVPGKSPLLRHALPAGMLPEQWNTVFIPLII